MGEGEKVLTAGGTDSAAGPEAEGRKRGINWSDPTVPVGDSPPMARWPLVVAGIAWFCGIVFLAAMAVSRLRTETF